MQALPSNVDPGVQYVMHVLVNVPQLVTQGYKPEHIAQFLKQNMTPQQLSSLLTQPLTNIVNGIPQLRPCQGELSQALAILQGSRSQTKIRRTVMPPQADSPPQVDSPPNIQRKEHTIDSKPEDIVKPELDKMPVEEDGLVRVSLRK